jgi:hypothetical protein
MKKSIPSKKPKTPVASEVTSKSKAIVQIESKASSKANSKASSGKATPKRSQILPVKK